jgi:hypothetical protein
MAFEQVDIVMFLLFFGAAAGERACDEFCDRNLGARGANV